MAITVAGVLRDSSNSPITGGSSKTMVVYKNGVSQESVETNTGDGTYNFASFSASAGDSVFVVIEGESEKGSVHTVTDGTTNLTAFDVRDDRMRVQNDNAGGKTTNADLEDRDKDDDATNLFFTSNSNTLTLDAGRNLEVVSGNTFKPTGTCDIGTDTVGGTSVFLAGTWEETSGDNLNMKRAILDATGGAYTAGSGTITFSGNAAIAWTNLNSITIASLTINTTGQFVVDGTMTVSGTLTLTDGDFDGSGTLNWTGATCTMAAAFGFNGTTNNGVINVTGTGAQALSSSGGIFPAININKSAGVATFTGDAGDSNRFIILKPFTLTSATATADFTTNTVLLELVAPSGSGTITTFSVSPGLSLHNFELDSGAGTVITGVVTVNNDYTWTDGNWTLNTNEDTDRMDLHGDCTVAAAAGDAILGNRATVRLVGTGAQLITNSGVWCALQINKPSGTATFAGDGANEFRLVGQFEHTTGTVDWTTNTVRLVIATPSGSGTFRDFDPNGITFHQLEFDMISSRELLSACTVQDNLFLTDGEVDQNVGGNIQVEGGVTIAAAYGSTGANNDSLITLTGSDAAAITITTGGILPVITLDKTNVTDVVTVSGGTFQTQGDLTLEKGTIRFSGIDINIGGDTIKGAGVSTFEFSGTGNQTPTDLGSSPVFDTLKIDKTSGSVQFDAAWTCDKLEFADNQTVVLGSTLTYTINTSGNFTVSGTAGGGITLTATSAGSAAKLILTTGGTQDVDFVDVKDIDSSTGEVIVNTGGTDSGNNTNWTFPAPAVATTNIEAANGTLFIAVTPLFDAADIPGEQRIVEVDDGSTSNSLILRFSSSGEFVWIVTSGGVIQATVTSTTTATRGTTVVLAVTWGTNVAELFVDGVSEGTPGVTVTAPADIKAPLRLGHSRSDTLFAFCNFAQWWIYDAVLSDNDITVKTNESKSKLGV